GRAPEGRLVEGPAESEVERQHPGDASRVPLHQRVEIAEPDAQRLEPKLTGPPSRQRASGPDGSGAVLGCDRDRIEDGRAVDRDPDRIGESPAPPEDPGGERIDPKAPDRVRLRAPVAPG